MSRLQVAKSPAGQVERSVLRVVRHAAMLVVALLMFACAGCALVGVAAYKFMPPPDVQAVYVPASQPTIVYAHRASNPADAALEAQRIAQMVSADLVRHGIGPMLPSPTVGALGQRRSGGSVWGAATPVPGTAGKPATAVGAPIATTVAELGRSVGAKQVIYIDLVSFQIETAMASELTNGSAQAHVFVIDAVTGHPLWPGDFEQGYNVVVNSPYAKTGQKMTESVARDRMCRDMAIQISRLFYKYKPEDAEAEDAAAAGQW
jgi:hypothetical protein